ncbi:M20/M25/M40 family metallo-hydrolase [Streptomyces sp. HNM0645]|uniref:M20/M25/M40 family metallo-hydrolase n=1 Tax=Streptomyces sp. HNM0645 TaxID=2782343 RepID=UPI0024B85BA8|nr:M20/M25/M40 family metallo-hydrolase [Streptomyces sp. HNM0645]MDI9886521.1 M20/M25/M40 family metallo-hydrolase [Streptomyces sp. HNM0645]
MADRINADRLLSDLTHLSQIGAGPDGALWRVAGTKADRAGRDWLDKTMRVEGLHTYYDDIGNVFSRRENTSGPWLLIGSHADTVPAGGHLDGAYGVIAAMEVLRTLHETGHPMADHVETVAWFDEEGVGPQSAGGLVGSTALAGSAHADDLVGYLEIHVEQGRRMEDAGLDLAPVTGIVGVRRYQASVSGQDNHAGTTMWADRQDAGRVAARIVAALKDIILGIDPKGIGNAGVIHFGPGAANVVPGTAGAELEIRASSDSALDDIEADLHQTVSRIATEENCAATLTRISAKPAAHFDKLLLDIVEETCRANGRTDRLLSYAGHDASVLSTRLPTAMMFVPSTGGFSHSNKEHTPDEQLVLGTQALLESVLKMAPILLEQPKSPVALAA